METNKIRNQFPILNQKVHGSVPLVYLDNAATTQKPLSVLDCMDNYYRTLNSNIHRGVHFLSQEATETWEESRRAVAAFIGAPEPEQVVFTKGTTESINLVAQGYAWGNKESGFLPLQKGDKVAVTVADHHANFVTWQQVCVRTGAEFLVIPTLSDGSLDMEALDKVLAKKPRLMAFPHISNVLGIENPVKEIVRKAHAVGCAVLVDGAQAVAHTPVNVTDLDCDFYVWSGHKAYGPTGIGVLYGKREALEALPPYQFGGEMIADVSIEKTTFAELPFKFEAGTPPIAEAIALKKAVDFIKEIGFDTIKKHESELVKSAFDELKKIEGIEIYGREENHSGVISFNLQGAYHYDVGVILDQMGAAVRTGHHCAQPLMTYLGVPGTVRASFAVYNTLEEVAAFVKDLRKAASMLR